MKISITKKLQSSCVSKAIEILGTVYFYSNNISMKVERNFKFHVDSLARADYILSRSTPVASFGLGFYPK